MGTRFGIMVDFRNPPEQHRPDQTVYRETIETVQFAESLGYDDVWLSEHHFTPDGYCPSPLVVSAAIAAVTSTIAIGQALLLLPLHHPLRIAEDGATVDVISGGRFSLGVGIGYRPGEFKGFGLEVRDRVGRLEESLTIIDQAWRTGEVNFHGKHFQISKVLVRPRPVTQPRPAIWIGGLSEPAVRRAARLGDGLLAGGRRAYRWYLDELQALGRPIDNLRIAGAPQWYFVAHDPEQLRQRVSENLVIFHNTVAGYFDSAGQSMPMGPATSADLDSILASGSYVFCTPEECVERLSGYLTQVPLSNHYLLGALPGLDPKVSRSWIELFAREVIPGVRARLAHPLQ